MTQVLRTKAQALAFIQQSLSELREISARNEFEILTYVIEMAYTEALSTMPATAAARAPTK